MGQFIAQYWLQFVFGIIAGILGIGYRKVSKLLKQERQQKQNELVEEIFNKVHEEDQNLQNQIDGVTNTLDSIREGMLSVQGSQFRRKCRALLETGYKITDRDYDQIMADHAAYKKLNGNHEGDRLYGLVEEKIAHEGLVITEK